MIVAVIDVGSNTVRLLVAATDGRDVRPLREERAYLGLGAEIVRSGGLSEATLAETARVTRKFARTARRLDVDVLETLVTAPGRQVDDARPLLRALERATGSPPVVVSAGEEARLAFSGAVAAAAALPDVIAVCDVGGGSTEIAVGAPLRGPAWVRSLDLGSLRLTATLLGDDPPAAENVEAARAVVRRDVAPLSPPPADAALAVGGSARAVARIVGRTYGPDELERVVRIASAAGSAELAKEYGLEPGRARTLLAGALVLAELSRMLGSPLTVARGGLREGAVLSLAARRLAA